MTVGHALDGLVLITNCDNDPHALPCRDRYHCFGKTVGEGLGRIDGEKYGIEGEKIEGLTAIRAPALKPTNIQGFSETMMEGL